MKIPDDLINKATSRALRGVMEESGLQQKSWAQKSGLSLTVVQKLLSGNQSVKVPQLIALANASSFTPEEIMERIDRAVKKAVSATGRRLAALPPLGTPESDEAHDAAMNAIYDAIDEEEYDGPLAANNDVEHEQDQPADA